MIWRRLSLIAGALAGSSIARQDNRLAMVSIYGDPLNERLVDGLKTMDGDPQRIAFQR